MSNMNAEYCRGCCEKNNYYAFEQTGPTATQNCLPPEAPFRLRFRKSKNEPQRLEVPFLCVFVSLWSKSQSMQLKSVKSHKVLKEILRFMVQSKQVFYRAKVNCLRVVNLL